MLTRRVRTRWTVPALAIARRASVKLSATARRSLRRHRTLRVSLTVTAQAGTQPATKAVRARVRLLRAR